MKTELLPCPFCGAPPTVDAYDRGIAIVCTPCGYRRPFPGLLQTVRSDVPILSYRNRDGSIREIAPADATEFYHQNANEKAVAAWNVRA